MSFDLFINLLECYVGRCNYLLVIIYKNAESLLKKRKQKKNITYLYFPSILLQMIINDKFKFKQKLLISWYSNEKSCNNYK